ncbi:hypothetical protein AOLI_G00253670 [Acnodon oligacanthus]
MEVTLFLFGPGCREDGDWTGLTGLAGSELGEALLLLHHCLGGEGQGVRSSPQGRRGCSKAGDGLIERNQMSMKVDRWVDLQSKRPAGPLLPPCHAPQKPHRATPLHSNSLSPFHTEEKPTCGFHFCWNTDHRRHCHTDICPSNPRGR